MKTYHKTTLEVGTRVWHWQGTTTTAPQAVVTIETDDEDTLKALVNAVGFVEGSLGEEGVNSE